jgi:transposase
LVPVIVNKSGQVVEQASRISLGDSDRLLELLERYLPMEVVTETSPSWPWLHDLVRDREGIGFVLAHASRLRAIAASTYKRDEIDAELLARMHLAGLIPEVYPKSVDQRDRAVLVRHRRTLVQLRTQTANRVHAQLHSVGLRLPRGRLLTLAGRRWVRERAWPRLSEAQRELVEMHFALIDEVTGMIKTLDVRVRTVAKGIPDAVLLQSVPGIGSYRSLVITTEIGLIGRFPKPEHLVSYAGLAPRTRRSGVAPIRHGRIPAGANRWIRGALVQAVVTHMKHAPESWLAGYYNTQKARIGWQAARIATARKLARVIHAMLRNNTPWRSEASSEG